LVSASKIPQPGVVQRASSRILEKRIELDARAARQILHLRSMVHHMQLATIGHTHFERMQSAQELSQLRRKTALYVR